MVPGIRVAASVMMCSTDRDITAALCVLDWSGRHCGQSMVLQMLQSVCVCVRLVWGDWIRVWLQRWLCRCAERVCLCLSASAIVVRWKRPFVERTAVAAAPVYGSDCVHSIEQSSLFHRYHFQSVRFLTLAQFSMVPNLPPFWEWACICVCYGV